MAIADTIHEMIVEYLGKYNAAVKKARPGAGLFGFGSGPKDDPCHAEFLEKLAAYTDSLTAVPPEEANAAVRLVIGYALDRSLPECCHWVFVAAERCTFGLISEMLPEERAVLLAQYEKAVPRLQRFPVEKELVRALGQ